MKHFYFYFLLLIPFSLCYGQNKEVRIGFDIAPSFVKVGGASEFRTSYSGGLNFEFYLNSKLSFKSGLNYESKGSKSEIEWQDHTGRVTGTDKLTEYNNYLVVPVLIKYNFNNPVYINAGTYCGYLLNNSSKLNDKTYGTPVVKAFDFGLIGSIGARFHLTDKLNLNLESRLNMGLLNINDSPYSSLKNISYELLIGFDYKIK